MKLDLLRREGFGWSIGLGVLAFLGSGHISIRTSMYGIAFHMDSSHFIGAAEALATGQSSAETLATGQDYESLPTWFPPLLPILLSFYKLLGVEAVDMGRYVNIIIFGLIILVAGHWLYRTVRSHLGIIGAVIAITVSYPLVRISSQLFSEPLFVLMTLSALVNMESFLGNRKVKAGLWLSIIFSALAFLTRWMGFTVVLAGALLILTDQETPISVKWKRAAIYSVASSLPATLWIARNWIVYRILTGRQDCVTNQSIWDSLSQFGDQLHLWIFVRHSLGWLVICLWVAVALIGFEAAKALTARSISASGWGVALFRKVGSLFNTREQPVMPFVTFVMVYLVVLFAIAPYTTCELPTASRYLLPIYVPATMTAIVWLERFLSNTYQNSGVSVWKSSGSWGLSYNKAYGPMATTRWITIGILLTIILANITRNIALYIDILSTYDPYGYQF